MAHINLITAVHPELTAHLPETEASVVELRAALQDSELSLRWLVAVDGPDFLDLPAADLVLTQSRSSGVAATRNLALTYAEPGWVFRLDADDLVDPAGWRALVDHPGFGSAAYHPTNMLTLDGQPTSHWFDASERFPVSSIEERWTSPFVFHPNNIVVATDVALASGGWPAMRVNEDIGWCFAVSALAEGLSIPVTTLRYRRWASQTVADASYRRDKAQAFQYLEKVVNARRALTGRPPISAPVPGPAALHADG